MNNNTNKRNTNIGGIEYATKFAANARPYEIFMNKSVDPKALYYKDGNNVAHPIANTGGGVATLVVPVTTVALDGLIAMSTLVAGVTYLDTDKNIWFRAISSNQLDSAAIRSMRVVKADYYIPAGNILGVWYQALPAANIGDLVVWGGQIWQNVNGNVGVATSDLILNAEWAQVPITDSAFYESKIFNIIYDFANDWISKQSDDRGNELGMSYEGSIYDGYSYNPIDISDWGNGKIYGNKCYGIYNNSNNNEIIYNTVVGAIYSNSNVGSIYYNEIIGYLYQNRNIGDIIKNIITGSLASNSNNGVVGFNVNTGVTNNSNNGSISYNMNEGSITNNSNNGVIQYNSNNGAVSSNSNDGEIFKNLNNGGVANNANSSGISFNLNNGDIISLTSIVTTVYYNNNNGSINTSVIGVINDPVVNK